MGETPSTNPPRDSDESRALLRTSAAAREIERRLFLKQGLSLGALTLLTGCDVTDTSAVQSVLDGISRWNDRTQAVIFNPRRLMPTYPESQAVKDFRLQRLFRSEPSPQNRRGQLQAHFIRAGRPQDALDAARALSAAPGIAGDAARLRRRLEHDRQMDRGPVPDLPTAHRRGLDRKICRLRMRRRILFQHRHGIGAAPANLPHLQDFRRDPGAPLRLSAQTAHSNQARVQE